MEIKRTMIASQLIIEAGEQYHKRPTQLKFEELVDVVQAVVKNCFIPPVMPSLQHSDDMCFHECPNCNSRCNCSSQPCSCCNEV